MKKQIFYLTDLLSPYRIEWMNMLSKKFDIYAYVFDSAEITRTKEWLESQKPLFAVNKVDFKRILGIRFSKSVLNIIKRSNYDLYIIDGYSSYIQYKSIIELAKNRKSVFVNVDGIDIWKKTSFIKKLIKRRIYSSGAMFLCGSELAAENIINHGAKRNKVFIHHFTSLHKSDLMSIDEKIKMQKKYKKMVGSNGSKMVLAVGRFIYLKRYEDLLYSWKSVPKDWELFLIGGGELKNKYEDIIKTIGLQNVYIIDYLKPDLLVNYFIAADLFVHPSETETWGLVINEAMAKCCPCLSTDHCVAGVELITNGVNGYVIPVGDIKMLSMRIVDILSDKNKHLAMMKSASDAIREYTIENMTETHSEIFEKDMQNDLD